ncbi:MAG: hypothetical protein U0746_23010 [Gemmataceae bacterium]
MPDLAIEQLLAESAAAGPQVTARSPGLRDEWVPDLLRLCTAFGVPLADTFLPPCVFAQPVGKKHVAVVTVTADGSPPRLRYHALVMARSLYATIGDPFALAEQFPAPWGTTVALPTLAWLEGPPPSRTVAQVQRVLQEDDSATLLGGTQALLDGSRLAFERPFPAPDLMRRLWSLLPDSTRAELWPASYVLGPGLELHAVVVPALDAKDWPNYLTEQQAGDYPDGRYEHSLQVAAEAEDQHGIDQLFARRTSRQTLQLAVAILLFAIVASLLTQLL